MLAPWDWKSTREKTVLAFASLFFLWEAIQWFEAGSSFEAIMLATYWMSIGWAYFSEPPSRRVMTELKLNRPQSTIQSEGRAIVAK